MSANIPPYSEASGGPKTPEASSFVKAAVIGHPISHSLSPLLHGYWLDQLSIQGSYEAIDIHPGQLHDGLLDLQKQGYRGVNLTVPHKELVIPMLHTSKILTREVSERTSLVRRIGAVNTIIFTDNGFEGMNTDAEGFLQNLQENDSLFSTRKSALVIGAGGAARAVIVALQEAGLSVSVTNRTLERVQTLQNELAEASQSRLSGSFPDNPSVSSSFDIPAPVTIIPWEQRHGALEGMDLVVNTTSLGMQGQPPLELKLDALPLKALVHDIVYAPLITPLLGAAQARGNPIVDGLGMLLYQAVPAFEAFFGKRPSVTNELRDAVLRAKR